MERCLQVSTSWRECRLIIGWDQWVGFVTMCFVNKAVLQKMRQVTTARWTRLWRCVGYDVTSASLVVIRTT